MRTLEPDEGTALRWEGNEVVCERPETKCLSICELLGSKQESFPQRNGFGEFVFMLMGISDI